MGSTESLEPLHLDRYVLHAPIASGGMASVHLGRVQGARGFARTVAIKRLHPQFATDPEFSSMLLDEARLTSAIRHGNVVPTLDVVQAGDELFMVMEYVPGESLSRLLQEARARGVRVPAPIGVAILAGALEGLHAAHEARSDEGVALQIVHRDVSPQNILVGRDGIPRLLDFGIARAAVRAQVTREGQLKGKLRYMAPEQLRRRRDTDRRIDVYAAGVVLWEVLTGEKLFDGESEAEVFGNVLEAVVPEPSARVGLPAAVDPVVLRAVARDPEERFPTALAMAEALVAALPPASPAEVGLWVDGLVGDVLAERAAALAELDEPRDSMRSAPPSARGERSEAPPPSAPRSRRVMPAPVSAQTQTLTAAALPAARSVLKPVAMEVPALVVRQREATPRPGRGRLRALGVLVGGPLVAALALAVLVALRRPGGAAAGPPEPVPSAATAAASATVEPPPAPVPSAAAVSPPDPPPPSAGAPSSVRARPAPARSQSRSPPRCSPPYTVDGAGIRRVKRECF